MPRNVQDFKDHPHYALERHLRRREVIHPRVEIGRVATGKQSAIDSSKTVEPIYRRAHIKAVKSADKWYRMGREIKVRSRILFECPRLTQSAWRATTKVRCQTSK
jgi:xeroderma pigmentosum group C-complementing protein